MREDEIYTLAAEVREGPDDAIWRDHRSIGDHELFEFGGVEEFAVEGFDVVHDQSCGCEVPDPLGVGV